MKRLLLKILSFFPTKLPVGLTDFDTWQNSIIELSGKFADEDSMKWAIANMVMHLPSTKSSAPKNYFVNCLRKTAANQIAGQVFINIKEKQEAARKAVEDQSVEATTLPVVVLDETKKG